MVPGDVLVFDTGCLDTLIRLLREAGYRTRGPVVNDGVIVPADVSAVSDLPIGWHDGQAAGAYTLRRSGDDELFGWAVGPGSWKPELFPPAEVLWQGTVDGGRVRLMEPAPTGGDRTLAIVGARPCDLSALTVLDRVLTGGDVADPGYRRRRNDAFIVVAECSSPSGNCFCAAMGTGPAAPDGYDVAVTELGDAGGHRLLARAGTQRGADLISAITSHKATEADLEARQALLMRARSEMVGRLDTDDLPGLLARNPEHPRWDVVAGRCLACGNCTSVCPTCFCSNVRDATDLDGKVSRRRWWSSCFDLEHSLLHGGAVRRSTASRYRQWMTHKLSTWWDQFGTSGCVGCGRCITWCPVGISITDEATAIRASDGGRGARSGSGRS